MLVVAVVVVVGGGAAGDSERLWYAKRIARTDGMWDPSWRMH